MAAIKIPDIRFIDIAGNEKRATQGVTIDRDRLVARRAKLGGLSAADQVELDRLEALLRAAPANLDPLFVTASAALGRADSGLTAIKVEQKDGMLSFPDIADEATKDAETARVALILGLLQLHGAPLPELKADGGAVRPDPFHRNGAPFTEALFRAAGHVAGKLGLGRRILAMMADAVDLRGDGAAPQISTLEYAKVFERLVERGVTERDPNLKRRVDEVLDRVQESPDEKPPHETEIDLPDLEEEVDQGVLKDNIRLTGPMIFASMFDELKAFQVVDKLIDMSQRGELPLLRGKAGTQLYSYWRQAPNRMSEMERQTFYAMTLGIPTGQPGVRVNGDFQDLWIRFVSSVSALVRESRVDQLLRSSAPAAVNQQQVKKAARDLASNMSLFGYGMAYYAAVDLQKQIREMIELLKDPELRAAVGARDMWGVIDQVAQVELGGARNSSKYRTLATCGGIITNWLADNLDRLRDPTRPMIDLREVENPPARPSGQTATSHPTDYDLVNACELWLADSAVSDMRIEQLAREPRDSPQQPSRPIQIPSIARDLLEGTGLGMEMGAGPRRGARGLPSRYTGY